MRPTAVVAVFLFLTFHSSLVAQNEYTFSQFANESGTFFTQPLRWDGSDYLNLGMIGAVTFLASRADLPVQTAVLKNQQYYYSVPIVGGRVWGEVYMPMILFSGFAAQSLIADDIGTRKIAYEIGQASIYGGLITQALKIGIGRARPYLNEGNATFHPFTTFNLEVDNESMPSGHTTVAFILSTVLSRNAKPTWLKIVAYVPAAFTMVSRVYQNQHWTSDTFMGAAIGFSIATWVVDTHERKDDSRVAITSVFPLTVRVALP
jgi:membrane-associated phospholipid phosphatase